MNKETAKNYNKLWGRVRVLDADAVRGLLCFLMGYCKHTEHFLKGVETGLPAYEAAMARRAKGR